MERDAKLQHWRYRQPAIKQNLRAKGEYIQQVFAFNNRSGPIWNCVYFGSSVSDEFGRRLSPKKQTPTRGKVSRGQPHWDEETNIDKRSKQHKRCHAASAAIPEHPKIYTVIQNINTRSMFPLNQYALSNKNESWILAKTREVGCS